MTLSIWDTMAIAGFILLWLMIFGTVITFLAGLIKKRQQKKQKEELYDRVMDAIKTDQDFSNIVRKLQKEAGDE